MCEKQLFTSRDKTKDENSNGPGYVPQAT